MTGPTDDRWLAGDAYEAYMGRWSRAAAAQFLRWLRPAPGLHWLELGCGTGVLTSALCTTGRAASVVACDPSEPFIAWARQSRADPRITFVVAPAESPPSRPGGFDAAVSGLVVNFLPDPVGALVAIGQRLRQGATLAAYVWDYSLGMEFLRIFWDEAIALDPGATALDEGRRFPLCHEAALASLWETAGLRDIHTGPVVVPTAFGSFEDYWTPFLSGTGPAPAYLASLRPEDVEALRQRLRQRLPPQPDGSIRLQARAWAVRGSVP